jgi:dTDP-4-dehydrorhamnose reductase
MMFVTGGTGLLGRHLQRTPVVEKSWELIVPGSTSLDVRQREAVLRMVGDWKPRVVVHLAYRKDDRRTIVDGSRHMAEAAAACGARLIHVSTDVVFAGRPAPYREGDPVSPMTDYGRMKAEAEHEVMAVCPAAVVLRTSLMYATDVLAPVQLDVQRALRGETTTAFFTDEYRCPAHAGDVAAAIGVLASMPLVSGPLHIAGPEIVSRAELAATFARWLGLNPNLLRTTSLAAAGLHRPARVVLDSSKAAALGLRCRPLAEALR